MQETEEEETDEKMNYNIKLQDTRGLANRTETWMEKALGLHYD